MPLYDSLGENAIEYIIDHSESQFLVISSAKLAAFTAALPKITQTLKGVVYWGPESPSVQPGVAALQQRGTQCIPYTTFLTNGAANPMPEDPPSPQDICTIMYTSGTTGDPKGVLLTHASVVACVESLKAFMADNNLKLSHSARPLPPHLFNFQSLFALQRWRSAGHAPACARTALCAAAAAAPRLIAP